MQRFQDESSSSSSKQEQDYNDVFFLDPKIVGDASGSEQTWTGLGGTAIPPFVSYLDVSVLDLVERPADQPILARFSLLSHGAQHESCIVGLRNRVRNANEVISSVSFSDDDVRRFLVAGILNIRVMPGTLGGRRGATSAVDGFNVYFLNRNKERLHAGVSSAAEFSELCCNKVKRLSW